jgi:hypothetical protein
MNNSKVQSCHVSSYLDVSGARKYRILISYCEGKEYESQNLFSKNYDSESEATSFKNIFLDVLQIRGLGNSHPGLEDNSKRWDHCRYLGSDDLFQFIKTLHNEKREKFGTNDMYETMFEETRSSLWWRLNINTYSLNKRAAETILCNIQQSSQFKMFSPKLHNNYVASQRKDFFLVMKHYVNPATLENYFSFKIDLMRGIFDEETITSCFNHFSNYLFDDLINGQYVCDGTQKIICELIGNK